MITTMKNQLEKQDHWQTNRINWGNLGTRNEGISWCTPGVEALLVIANNLF